MYDEKDIERVEQQAFINGWEKAYDSYEMWNNYIVLLLTHFIVGISFLILGLLYR
jgi:hypothetical protein